MYSVWEPHYKGMALEGEKHLMQLQILLQNDLDMNAEGSLIKGRMEFPQLIEKSIYGEIWFTGVN